MNYLEIQFWRFAIYLLRKGYGADCEVSDWEDFPDLKNNPKVRCGSCRAKECIEFIEEHIELLKL